MKRVSIKSRFAKLIYILLAGVAIGTIVLWLQPAVPVVAHAILARSDPPADSVLPQSPAKVVLWFTESIDIKFSDIKVLDAQNRRWDNGDCASYENDPTTITVSLQKLPVGIYTVAWQNTSVVDGHSISGSFVFYIGISSSGAPVEPAQAQPLLPSPFELLLRWIELLGMLALVGGLVFELVITRPVLTSGSTVRLTREMDLRLEHRTLIVVLLAATTSLAGSLGELFTKVMTASASFQSLSLGGAAELILPTYWGHLWLWRVLTLFIIIIVTILVIAEWSVSRSGQRHWQMLVLVLGAFILFTFSMVSHDAATTTIRATAVFTDYVHLLAASIWIGGIIYLAVVMPPAMKIYRREIKDVGSGTYCPTSHVSALRRFSFLSLMSAGILVVTGLYSSWAQVTILQALITPYGITLLVKIGLILLLAVLGAVNLIWVRPRLAENRMALSVLNKATNTQAMLATAIILSVGMLVSLNPARQALTSIEMSRPAISINDSVDWARITVQVQPGEVGLNKFVVLLKDSNGKGVSDASSVGLLINCLNTDLGAYWQYASPVGQGQYILQTNLSIAGAWQANITVLRPNSFDINTSLKFDVMAAGTESVTVTTPSSKTGMILWGIELFMLGLLVIPARWITCYFDKHRTKGSVKEP